MLADRLRTTGCVIRARFRTWFAASFIGIYLSAIGAGCFCHTFNWQTGIHPTMYWFVWDMFCGWSAYEIRYHVIAEGVSGRYYNVLPGPWGECRPYGDLGRHHHDVDGTMSCRLAMNVLRQTQHEDIVRMSVIEETWSKKYNMPDEQWAMRWETPKDPKHYYTLRHIITDEGALLQSFDNFFAQQNGRDLASNPRLAAQANQSQPFYAVSVRQSPFRLSSALMNQDIQGRGDGLTVNP